MTDKSKERLPELPAGLPSLVRNVWKLGRIMYYHKVYVLMKLLTNDVLQQNLCSNEGIHFFKCHGIVRSTTSRRN